MIRDVIAALALGIAAHAMAAADPNVRESRSVITPQGPETWQLRWLETPRSVCAPPMDTGWNTCPCNGFAVGQVGKMALVRMRGGQDVDQLPLMSLFNEYPASHEVALQQKPVTHDEMIDADNPDLPARFAARPDVSIMDIADYDHDGQATEFFLQTESVPCGKRYGVVVGVTAANPRLHAFASLDQPDKPLKLPVQLWMMLRQSSGPVTYTAWPCGDHGAETEADMEAEATPGGIRVTQREFECTPDGTRGRLLKTQTR